MAGEPHSDAAAHGAEAAAHGGEHASGGFPPFDANLFEHQIFWFAITFGFLWWFLATQIVPNIAGVIEKRRATIQGDLDTAAAKSAEAEAAKAGAERSVAEARAKARDTVDKMRADMQAKLGEEQAKAEAALAEKAAAAEKQIAETRGAALSQVEGIARELARDIIAKVSGAAIKEVA
jgi:F-type H+-transporting ATPase subunit b